MKLIMNEEFMKETIIFDGNHFIGCSFTGCTILITSPDFDFDRCSFIDSAFHVDPRLAVFQSAQSIMSNPGSVWLEEIENNY